MPARRAAACDLLLLLAMSVPARAALIVTADFEGGAAVIESVDEKAGLIRITPPDLKDRGWACWWCIKVTGIARGQSITLEVGAHPKNKLGAGFALPQFAAYSIDGKTWRHTLAGKREGTKMRYMQAIDAEEAWFAWGPMFTPTDAKALVDRIAKTSPHAEAFELCKTRGNRPVPALRVRQPSDVADGGRYGVWIQARQHAWESGSSHVAAGLIEWLVSDDPRAESLRKTADIFIVPIMDIDNTAIGAGGKEQKPQDHNRDWSDAPHHVSVKAAQDRIAALDKAGAFDLFIDLHNPGPGDRQPFYFISPLDTLCDSGSRNLARFLDAGRQEITGPLKLADKPRESGPGYDKNWQRISKNWVTARTACHVVAVTLETSWNTPHSTVEGYRQVGREQGLALERYLRQSPRQ